MFYLCAFKIAMIVRKAVREDMKAVLELIQELANFENEPNAVEITVAQLENDGFGTHPLFHCFVAEEANEIIGIALFYYRYSTWKGKTIHLEDLIVRENKRGIGAGFALYKEIIQQGKRDGVKRIEWAVLDWNKSAIDFYQKTGAKVFDDWRVAQLDEQGINAFIEQDLN